MGDKTQGLYGKFRIDRTDGKSARGEKHDGCDYFVLDLTHDAHAIPALRAYADSCEADYPLLARDLRAKVIPRSVYWSREAGNFYDDSTNKGMGVEFYERWKALKDLFPEKPTATAGVDLHLDKTVTPKNA